MAGRSYKSRLMKALLEDRGLELLTMKSETRSEKLFDRTAMIPGTGPEKVVFNYLDRLGIDFTFQYKMDDIPDTEYPENLYVPDFYLPAYNIEINVFGAYWHSMAGRRMKDLIQSARNLYAGRAVIESGVILFPEGGVANGKYIIWWETDIYIDLVHLVVRDCPEILSPDRIKGTADHFLEDWKKVADKAILRQRALNMGKIKPELAPMKKQIRVLQSNKKDLLKIYPFLKKR